MTVLRLQTILTLLLLQFAARSVARGGSSADSLFHLAELQFGQGAYSEALNLHMQALRGYEKSGDRYSETNSLLAVGKMHYYLQQRRTAFSWFATGLQRARHWRIDSVQIKALMNLGAICTEYNQPDSALLFFERATILLRSPSHRLSAKRKAWLLTNLYCTMSETWYKFKGNKRMAYRCVDEAERASRISNEYLALASTLIKRGQYNMLDGDCRTAEKLFRQALVLNRKAHATEEILYAMVLIADANSRCGKARAAFLLMRERQGIRDSIFKASTADNAARYAILYETERKDKANKLLAKEAQLSRLRLENEVKTRKIVLIASGCGLLLVLAGFLTAYHRYRRKKDAEMSRQLAAEQLLRFRAVIEGEERERVRVAREMHDGIGYLLSAARLNLSVVTPGTDDETVAVGNSMSLLDDAVQEVRTISHNLMPASLTELGLVPALRELCRKITEAGGVRATLESAGTPRGMDRTSEIALYRVVQEVVGNMLRHAQATAIQIYFCWEADRISLTLSDNGVGFDTRLVTRSSGIGWKNVYSRVAMLHGTVSVESASGMGSTICIQIPL
jgi:signal transduction histidine kinase